VNARRYESVSDLAFSESRARADLLEFREGQSWLARIQEDAALQGF